MKKKIFIPLFVTVLTCLSIGLCCCGKKEDPASEEVMQSSEDIVQEKVVQVPVDEACFELLEKMKIVKDAAEFEGELLAKPCDMSKAYEMLNTMKGQDGAEVPVSYQGQQITQNELLALYLKELFGIEVKEAAGENFEAYANELEIKDYFSNQEAEATNNNLISLAYACVHYGLDDWENTKTVFQQMLESGFFNGMDIATFKVAAMDDIFNYGTNKCPAREVYDKDTGRTYYFLDYFGNSYNSSGIKNQAAIGSSRTKKEILLRPYLAQQNMTADGTGIVFTRYPGGLTYVYDTETQTMKYIDTVYCETDASYWMYMTPSDTLYYLKDIDGKKTIYRKNVWSDDEPEKVVATESGFMLHVTNDEKYASIYSTKYKGDGGKQGFVRIDIENKKVEIVASHDFTTTRLPGGSNNNMLDHIKINPVYPELFFFAHDYDGTYLQNCLDRANIMNANTGEVITINPGICPDELINDLPKVYNVFTHESWSENGEYLYITMIYGEGARRGMIRVNKDGTHPLYITNPGLDEVYTVKNGTERRLFSNHAAASGDDRYCVLQGGYITIISQETNQIFPIADLKVPDSHKSHVLNDKHPYHAHPTVSRGDTYLANWGQYYVPPELADIPDSGSLGIGYVDFSDIDENEVAKGGDFEYNEYVSRLSYEGIDCESEIGTFFEKDAIHAKAGSYASFNINTSIVDSINDTVTITFDYYDNGAQDLKLIYTKAIESDADYGRSDNGAADIPCTNTGEWKKAEIVVHGDFETSGYYGTDFKIGSETSDTYIANIVVKKNK